MGFFQFQMISSINEMHIIVCEATAAVRAFGQQSSLTPAVRPRHIWLSWGMASLELKMDWLIHSDGWTVGRSVNGLIHSPLQSIKKHALDTHDSDWAQTEQWIKKLITFDVFKSAAGYSWWFTFWAINKTQILQISRWCSCICNTKHRFMIYYDWETYLLSLVSLK